MLISAEPKISDTDLSRQEKVGQGSFGTVETAQWHKLSVAVKNFTDVRYFHDELAVYKNLLHADSPHIVRMLGYSTSNLLVLELMSKDLKEHITGLKSPLPLIQSLHLILQIAKALRHLHNMDVVHRDLKPANVLLKTRMDGSLLIKLTDFGISKHSFGFATSHTCFQGTMMYMAPEMLAGSTKYSRKVDVYSFGLISLEILAGKVRQNREEELTLPKDIPKMLISLINSCMEFNDVKRPGFDEICDSLWLVKEEVLAKVKISGLRGIRIENFPSASAIHPNQDNANSRRRMFLPIISPCSTLTGKRAIYALSHNDICKGRYSVTDLPVDILVDIMLVGSVRLIASGQLKIEDLWNTLLNPYESIALESRHPEDLGIFGQFKKLLKDQGKKFNLYLYIGGWDNSECFSTAFSTATSRTIFVNSVVGLLKSYPIFNGLVIDWSYISDNGKNYGKAGNVTSEKDVDNLVLTLEVLRKELPVGSFMIALTCTSSAAQEWPIEKAIHLLDQIHVNLPVISSKITSHRSALYASSSFEQHNTDETVKMYISHGVPSSKIFIMGSLDSIRYADTDGIGMPAGSWNWDPDYKELPEAGSEEKWDDEAKAAYAHHPIRRVIDTYDNNKSMVEKAKYIKENDLGGILVLWAHNDFPYMHERSTMKALHKYLTHS